MPKNSRAPTSDSIDLIEMTTIDSTRKNSLGAEKAEMARKVEKAKKGQRAENAAPSGTCPSKTRSCGGGLQVEAGASNRLGFFYFVSIDLRQFAVFAGVYEVF